MKKGEIYEAVVEKIEFPNKGILHVEEEKVIVKNAISGQKVRFVINKKRNGKCEGRLLEVLEASPLEQSEDACPHFGVSLKASKEVLFLMVTETKWNFLLVMNTKEVPWHLECTKEAVFMIL